MKRLLGCLTTFLLVAVAAGDAAPIDVQQSTMTVHVFKTGVFSAFGHNHEVRAPIAEGTLDPQARTVEFRVRSADLKVLDPDISDKDRAETQSTMQGPQVLDVAQYPEISFRSTAIEPAGAGEWNVRGELTLRGQTRPVEVKVAEAGGHYRGSAVLRQKDFGIKPVSAAGGAVKVKDELKIDFDIVGATAHSSH